MKNKTRLRIHIASDLLGIRLTPSTRLRDPYAAKVPTQHILTFRQIDLWNFLFPNNRSRVVDIKDKTLDAAVNDIVARLPKDGTAKMIPAPNGATLEIIVPR
jgi:hypothetical protein